MGLPRRRRPSSGSLFHDLVFPLHGRPRPVPPLGILACFLQPPPPAWGVRGGPAAFHPPNLAAGLADGVPQCPGKAGIGLHARQVLGMLVGVAGVRHVHLSPLVPRHVPEVLLGDHAEKPIGAVEEDVAGGYDGLGVELGVAEEDDAHHEQHGPQGHEEAIPRRSHAVLALLGARVELARDVVVALDQDESGLAGADHHVCRGDRALVWRTNHERGSPPAGVADERGLQRNDKDGDKSISIAPIGGKAKDDQSQGKREDSKEVDGARERRRDRGPGPGLEGRIGDESGQFLFGGAPTVNALCRGSLGAASFQIRATFIFRHCGLWGLGGAGAGVGQASWQQISRPARHPLLERTSGRVLGLVGVGDFYDLERVVFGIFEGVDDVGEEADGAHVDAIVDAGDVGDVGGQAGGARGLQEGLRGGQDARQEAQHGGGHGLGIVGHGGLANDGEQGDGIEAPVLFGDGEPVGDDVVGHGDEVDNGNQQSRPDMARPVVLISRPHGAAAASTAILTCQLVPKDEAHWWC